MKLTKRVIAVGAVATALTLSAAGFVAAAGVSGNGPASVLSELVDDGTLTQKQANQVEKAFEDHREEMRSEHEARHAETAALISSTLGISEDELKAAREEGKTLADLAGDKTDELISVLVDEMNAKIDEGVAQGRLTQEQADEMKANAPERVTAMVNGERPEGAGRAGPGSRGFGGPGGHGGPRGEGFGGPGGPGAPQSDDGSTQNSVDAA